MKSRRRSKPGRPDSAVIIESWRARAETAFSRHELRRRRWVELAPVARTWRHVVAVIELVTRDWPRQLAARMGKLSPAEARLLPWADGPRVILPTPAWEMVKAQTLLRELLADPSSWPLIEADVLAEATVRGISEWSVRQKALLVGVEMRGGLWHRPAPGRRAWLEAPTQEAVRRLDMAESAKRYPAPFLQPLLETFAHVIETAREVRALEAVLTEPRPLPLPPMPTTSAAAREQYLHAQAMQARLRTAVERGGYVRRALATAAVMQALAGFRARWWSWRGQAITVAGNAQAARAAAEALRAVALANLATLDGLLPPMTETPTRKKLSRPMRRAKKLAVRRR